jgi:hypothetical protein
MACVAARPCFPMLDDAVFPYPKVGAGADADICPVRAPAWAQLPTLRFSERRRHHLCGTSSGVLMAGLTAGERETPAVEQ